MKRLLGEAIRPVLPELPAGWDIVLSARTLTVTADLQALQQDIVTLLRRAHLLAASHR
jgi:RNase P protein component